MMGLEDALRTARKFFRLHQQTRRIPHLSPVFIRRMLALHMPPHYRLEIAENLLPLDDACFVGAIVPQGKSIANGNGLIAIR